MTITRLTSLSIRGFRSITGPVTVKFPETGLVRLHGKNKDTGGSSGAGKSSIPLAISYAFGFCPYAATALQSWKTEDKLQIGVVLQTAEGPIRLERGSKTSLQDLYNAKPITGVANVEAGLLKALGLPPSLLGPLTYRGQKMRSFFLSMTDEKKKDFLCEVLDLGKFEAAAEAATSKAKALEVTVEAAKW